jgi:hypothetical protein
MLLAGLTPAQGFVVCIEADGCVSIEVKTAGEVCVTCEGHEPRAPATATVSDPTTPAACPCVDYVVSGHQCEQAVKSRSVDLRVGPRVAPAAELRVVPQTEAAVRERAPPPRPLRAAQTLAHIRSVILRV